MDDVLGLGIERCCGLVQDDDRSVLQQRSGDGDPLPFAAGQLNPLLPHDGVEAHGALGNEPLGMGIACALRNLGVAGIVPRVADVVANRPV
jgi:hypothetical protein